jgi:hypothetical protein
VTPETLPFEIQQGAPAELHLRLKSKELAGNPPIPLIGYGANWEIWDPKRRRKFAEVAVDWPNRADGQIRGRLTAEQTLAIPTRAGRAVHDLHLFPPGADSYYVVEGGAVAVTRVSRDAP